MSRFEVSQRAAQIAKELNLSLSAFARKALQDAIDAVEQAKLERELEEGCKANYDYYKQEAQAWENVENDLF